VSTALVPVLLSFIWSLNPAVVSKWGKKSPPLLFTSVRALFALLFLVPALFIFEAKSTAFSANKLPVGVLLAIFLSAVTGPGIGDAAYVKSIQLLGGPLAVTISYTYIFFTELIAFLLGVEKVTQWALLGSIVAFVGVVVAVAAKNSHVKLEGVAYALVAAVNWGLATVLIRYARDYLDPVALSIVRLSIVVVVMLLASFLLKEELSVNRGFFVAALVTGVLGWGVGMALFIYSIYSIGASTTAIATALTPILSQITSRLIARERVSLRLLLGALVVGAGIAISNMHQNT
jgi:DME family drug/metabolite transporter